MDQEVKQTRRRRIVGTVLVVLPGIALGSSALLKFARLPGVVQQMAASGFADGKLMLVATLEILSVALFLLPRTRSLGVLVLSAFMGGAICTHVQLGEYAKAGGPSILLLLAWIGTGLRHPEALWSLNVRRLSSTQPVQRATVLLPEARDCENNGFSEKAPTDLTTNNVKSTVMQ